MIDHMLSIHAYIEVKVDRRTYLDSIVREINTSGFIKLVLIRLFHYKMLSGKKVARTLIK